MGSATGSLRVNRTPKDGEPGRPGDTGKTGAQIRPRGKFVPGETYVWNDTYRDLVLYGEQPNLGTYLVKTYGSSVEAAPTGATDANWEKADQFKTVATELLLARKILASEIDVNSLRTNEAFIKELVVQNLSAFIDGDGGVKISQADKAITLFDENGDIKMKIHAGAMSEFNDNNNSFLIPDHSYIFPLPSDSDFFSGVYEYTLATIVVSNPANQIVIPAAAMKLEATFEYSSQAYVSGTLELLLDDSPISSLQIETDEYNGEESLSLPTQYYSLAIGTHTIKMRLNCNLASPNKDYCILEGSVDFTPNTGTLRYINKMFEITPEAIRFATDDTRFWELKRLANGNIVETKRGVTSQT